MCKLAHRILVLSTISLSVAWASDWPRFLGPNADGTSPETGINKDWKTKPPKELWRISLTDDGYAGPSVAAGKLHIIDHKGAADVVRAVDVATGKDAWTFSYPDTDKKLYGFARATPTYDNGKLYTASRFAVLHCLDAEKGTKLWSRDLKKEFKGKRRNEGKFDWGYAESPRIDGDRLIFCPGGPGAAMVVLDKNSGQDIWKGGGDDQAGYGSTAIGTIGGKKQYVSFGGVGLFGVDAEKGALLWRYQWETEWDVNTATPIIIGDAVFISSGYGRGCALISVAGNKAEKVWQNANLQEHFSTPVLSGGYIYGVGDPNKLMCLDPKTGKLMWSQGGFGKGSVIALDGVLIVLNGGTGDVAMVKIAPESYQEMGRFKPLGGESWTAPIVADGKLFIRNHTALVCLDLK